MPFSTNDAKKLNVISFKPALLKSYSSHANKQKRVVSTLYAAFFLQVWLLEHSWHAVALLSF